MLWRRQTISRMTQRSLGVGGGAAGLGNVLLEFGSPSVDVCPRPEVLVVASSSLTSYLPGLMPQGSCSRIIKDFMNTHGIGNQRPQTLSLVDKSVFGLLI